MSKHKRRHKFIYRNNRLQFSHPYSHITKKTIEWNNQSWQITIEKNNINDLTNIAIELWKIEKKANKLKASIWEDNIKWFWFPIQRIYEILQENWIKITDYTWKKYIEGMNGIEVISVEKDEKQHEPIILDSINPLIEVNWVIKIRSKVVLLSA